MSDIVESKKNTINIKKFMHTHAYKKLSDTEIIEVRIAPDAVTEMISYIDARMDVWMRYAVENALLHKRKTVRSEDVVAAMSMKEC